MEMSSEQRIDASRERVWAALNDPAILQRAMPGCESFEVVDEHRYRAAITAKIGPVKARFQFNVELDDLDPPNAYTINGEGQGGVAGFASGKAVVRLREQDAGTVLAWQVKASVGGKLAQLGSRLIDSAASKIADEFFANFVELVADEPQASSEPASASRVAGPRRPAGLPLWVWVTAVVLIAAMLAGSLG